jgi:inorganic phosphate transporter, PiT family
MGTDIILVIVVATALAFDFTNGFHDTANVVAPAISTRAIAPRPAVAWLLTLPAAAVISALVYDASSLFGAVATGPIVISAVLIAVTSLAVARRSAKAAPAPLSP